MRSFPDHEALRGFTGFLMRRVSAASFERFSRATAEHGLHPMHFGMLEILDAEGPIAQGELSRRTGIDPSTMVARMDVLDDLGLVERTRSRRDRRSYEIRLSDKGRATLVELRLAASKANERLYGVLSAEERETLNAILRKLAAALDEQQ